MIFFFFFLGAALRACLCALDWLSDDAFLHHNNWGPDDSNVLMILNCCFWSLLGANHHRFECENYTKLRKTKNHAADYGWMCNMFLESRLLSFQPWQVGLYFLLSVSVFTSHSLWPLALNCWPMMQSPCHCQFKFPSQSEHGSGRVPSSSCL